MAFVAPVMRWPDAVASHLPQPLKDTGIPAQYFVIIPATLLAVILTYTLTKASAKVNAPHLASLVSAHSDYTAKRSQNRPSTVVLVGLSDAGKTSLFASLVYGSTPATVPSQTMSQGVVSTSALSDTLKPVTVVDLPGHARLRPLVDEHLHQADGLVICVDAVTASKASTPSTRPAGDVATITDVADLIHSTLTTLAKQRARSSTNVAPPCVLVLFTRADLSPLLGGSAAGTDAAKDEKRRAQLLARCKTTLEAELGQRRANMGFGRRKTAGGGGARNVSIAGLGKVADADPGVTGTEEGVFGWVKRALGLAGKLGFGGAVDAAGAEDEDDDEDEVVDYIDWAASQRVLNSNDASGAALGAPSLNLNKLDDHVVFGGKVEFALASVGKERSWSQQSEHAGEGKEPGKKADASGGLDDFKRWIADLQS